MPVTQTRTATTTTVLQFRVIAETEKANTVMTYLTSYVRKLYGPDYTYRTTTRPARRIGHSRVYLTVTHKEVNTNDHQHDDVQHG